jgi:hypothetical protein
MSATEMASREKTRRRITRADVAATLVVCAAYLSYLWIWPMYREYDRIPFTWSALELHKVAVLIPWLTIAIVYARRRLLIAFLAHTPVAVICGLICAYTLVFSIELPEDKLNYAYRLINVDSQRLVLVSLFSLPFALLNVLVPSTRRIRPAPEATQDLNPRSGRLPPRSRPIGALVFIAIPGQLFLLLPEEPATIFGRGTIEQLTRQVIAKQGVDPHDADHPEDSLITRDVAIAGRWERPWDSGGCSWIDIIPASDDGSYLVGAGRSTVPAPMIQRRTGRFRNGELVLDRPVLDFGSIRACTRFFFIRSHGQEMLISSLNVEEFNEYKAGKIPESGAPPWNRLVILRRSIEP